MSIKITHINKNSILRQYGIKRGDIILSINNRDIWNYEGVVCESSLNMMTLRIEKKSGIAVDIPLHREQYENIAAEFDEEPMMQCCNNCVFCFVRQNHPNMRSTMYVRDDDYRLSLQYGNFITLSNLKPYHVKDIIEHKFSPLYLSLHASEPDIRAKLFGRPMPMDTLNELINNHIEFHVQIVLVRGVNDGNHLVKTLAFARENDFLSTGIVPCGLTGYRDNLEQIDAMDRSYYADTVNSVEHWKEENSFKRIYIADEFYIGGDLPIPKSDYYDDYPQIDNGIGMVRDFLDTTEAYNMKPLKPNHCILTGTLFGGYLKKHGMFGSSILTADNDYFGGHVNVTGLLTGNDIIRALTNTDCEHIILYHSIFNEGVTLDDMSKEYIERQSGKSLHILEHYSELEQYTLCQ